MSTLRYEESYVELKIHDGHYKYLLRTPEAYQEVLELVKRDYPDAKDSEEPPASLPAVATFYCDSSPYRDYIVVVYVYQEDFLTK